MKIDSKKHVTKNGVVKRNPKRKLDYPKTITDEYDEIFTLALVNKNNVYYTSESGEEVKMYDRKMKLISDNYFAEEDFVAESIRAIKNNNAVYIRPDVAKGAKYNYNQDREMWDEELK